MLNPSPTEPSPPPDSGAPGEHPIAERTERWQAKECPFGIDYSAAFLERIRERAVEGFHTLPNGGLEIGGVLWGRVYPNARTPLRVELIAEKPIACSHANGPVFVLNDEEKAALAALLDRSRVDPELSAFSVAGFWVSHSRGGLALTPDDLDLYRTFFPYSWQIALILKPESGAPTRAAYFFRAGGEIAPHQEWHRFYLKSGGGVERPTLAAAGETPRPEEKYQPIPKERRGELVTGIEAITGVAGKTQTDVPKRVGMPALALLMAIAAITGASAAYWWMSLGHVQKAPAPGREPSLEVFQVGNEFLIHWNAKYFEGEKPPSVELAIADRGRVRHVSIDESTLRGGYLVYKSLSRELQVNMTVTRGDGRAERFAGVLR